jgi:HEAT repeat protein
LWLEKLQSEQDESIRQEIMKALSYLTDGEVNLNMSPQECLNWWEANRERWTIPFPKSKKEFLEWLEKEGWEEQMLSIPSVITISRLEDEEAIDVLIRFLRHPNHLVRGISLGRIMILFGEQLPKEYALGVGTDDWETVGDLIEVGKYDWIRKKVMKLMKWMEDDKMANKIAKELLDWWQENRGKIKIYWQRAWNVNYELP